MASRKKFPVECIINLRDVPGRGREFEVVWEGYEGTTWEPEEGLKVDIPLQVDKFLQVQNFLKLCTTDTLELLTVWLEIFWPYRYSL